VYSVKVEFSQISVQFFLDIIWEPSLPKVNIWDSHSLSVFPIQLHRVYYVGSRGSSRKHYKNFQPTKHVILVNTYAFYKKQLFRKTLLKF